MLEHVDVVRADLHLRFEFGAVKRHGICLLKRRADSGGSQLKSLPLLPCMPFRVEKVLDYV
jgi:hypothetical protein